MLRLWETLGQAVLDTNFRRYRILEGRDSPLSKRMTLRRMHDKVNKLPGRHSLSRFEIAEVLRIFSIPRIVELARAICEQWHTFCNGHGLYAATSTEFNSAVGLALSDTSWVKGVIDQNPNDPTEDVYFDLTMEEKKCFRDFLCYSSPTAGETKQLLFDFESAAWSDVCAHSVTANKGYLHPYPRKDGDLIDPRRLTGSDLDWR